MATPLTLYLPIKQDSETQTVVKKLYDGFVEQITPALDEAKIVHYARLVLIPNANGAGTLAAVVITTFDGPMNPYLKFFWQSEGFKTFFLAFASLALVKPNPPVTDLTSFETFINSNNLSEPQDLYQAYPQTVLQIDAAFPPKS